MKTTILTGCHNLEIIPIHRVLRFARIGSKAIIGVLGQSEMSGAIPGTVRVSMEEESGIFVKTITFERAGVSPKTSDILSGWRHIPLIATYTDESGNRRVCGSTSYPLRFSYTDSGGVYSCKLEGSDTEQDSFL